MDDTRWAVAQSRRQYTALLVTEGNVFLEEALRLRPELNLVLASRRMCRPPPDAICISMTAFCLKPCPKQGLFGP